MGLITENFDSVYETKEYKRSRRAYTIECAFEYMVSLFITDAFLVNLLKHIGLNDALIGVISSFVSLAFLFQFFSIFVVQKITNTKRFAVIFHTSSQLIFMSLYLVPFLPISLEIKEVLVIVGVLGAYFGNYFVTSIIYKWGNSYVHPRHRADFTAVKEIISLGCGIVMTLGVGYVVDSFEAIGNVEGSFIFCAAGILIFCISDFICLMCIKNEVTFKEEIETDRIPIKEVLEKLFQNRGYINILITTALWRIGTYVTIGFLGTYRLYELGFTVLAVQVINVGGSISRMFASRILGRFSDKYSFARGIEVGFIFACAAFLCLFFTAPSSRLLIIVYTALLNISHAGTGGNMINITYSCVNAKYFVQATAINNSISGVLGFCATVLGSKIMEAFDGTPATVFGIDVYPQQILALISFAIFVAAVLFTRFVLTKQERLVQ